MRRSLSLVGMVALCVSLLGCVAQKKNALEGTWELVAAKYTIGDKTETNGGSREIKIITKTHVAFLSQKLERQKFAARGIDAERLDAAKTFDAGGGTYTLDGEKEGGEMADTKCRECQTMAAQMKLLLAELMKKPSDLNVSCEEIQSAMTAIFSSEERIARFGDSFRNSEAGLAYGKWTEHRIATGHTGAGFPGTLS